MDKSQKPHEPLDLEEEELCGSIKEMDVKEGEHITQLSKYIPPKKAKLRYIKTQIQPNSWFLHHYCQKRWCLRVRY